VSSLTHQIGGAHPCHDGDGAHPCIGPGQMLHVTGKDWDHADGGSALCDATVSKRNVSRSPEEAKSVCLSCLRKSPRLALWLLVQQLGLPTPNELKDAGMA